MKISGFTFIRNGFNLQYPFIESIQSILPVCDEFIVVVGNSEDGTRAAVAKLHPSKIKIIDSIWDDSLREGGKILAQQTNLALEHITGDWGFYLQGDEVIHENDLPTIVATAEKFVHAEEVDGLLFNWYHFFGNYDYIAKPRLRGVYPREVRLIKTGRNIRSYRDAQGFRIITPETGGIPPRLRVKKVDAHIFHYGKVRGPKAELQRAKSFHRLWHNDEWLEEYAYGKNNFDYTCPFSLVKFRGAHPAVMKEHIAKTNWDFLPENKFIQIPFKYRVMNVIESLTGWRPFEFRNYELVKDEK